MQLVVEDTYHGGLSSLGCFFCGFTHIFDCKGRLFFQTNKEIRDIFQKISFLRFTPHPLPLYGCKADEHWAQAE